MEHEIKITNELMNNKHWNENKLIPNFNRDICNYNYNLLFKIINPKYKTIKNNFFH